MFDNEKLISEMNAIRQVWTRGQMKDYSYRTGISYGIIKSNAHRFGRDMVEGVETTLYHIFERKAPDGVTTLIEVEPGDMEARKELHKNVVQMVQPIVPAAKQVFEPEAVSDEQRTHRVGRVLSDLPDSCVPEKDKHYVPFGAFKMVKNAIKTEKFFCWFIAGDSGNGKTSMPEQACAQTDRELIKVSISKATTEQDLLGDFRLLDGSTPFYYGPVAEAMRRGAVLLLDELTQGDTLRLMCLQDVMAGKALHIKKTGEIINPAPGFCIVCTGNSVGEGDMSTNQIYTGEEILNEAFRDRITGVIKHDYPPKTVETKILVNYLGVEHAEFAENLVKWAIISRENFKAGKLDRQITTRRLLHVVKNFELLEDKEDAIQLSLNRFNAEVSEALMSTYMMIDPTLDPAKMNKQPEAENNETV